MMARIFFFLALLVLATEAFMPAIMPRESSSALFSCRTNAKKEKIKRNRDNMRKFKTGGKRGISRRKLMKKGQASKARADEAEFIAKCFITVPAPNSEGKK